MLDDDDFNDEFDRTTPLQRYGLPAAAIVFVLVSAGIAYSLLGGGSGPAARPHNEPHITQVQLPPPPPPPPPPKTPPPPPKHEEVKQKEAAPMKASVPKAAPKAPTPPAAVTTSIQGNGPGSLLAGNDNGGDCVGAGCGPGDGGGGDNDAYYGNLVQSRIQDALRRDRKLEFAKYRVMVSFTLDPSGSFSNAAIASFAGDDDARAEVERVIREASTGDSPVAGIVGKRFSVRINSHARG